jgi:hypothetical protein
VAVISFYSGGLILYHYGVGGTVGDGWARSLLPRDVKWERSMRGTECSTPIARRSAHMPAQFILILLAEQRLNESRVMSREKTHRLPR